MDKNIHQEHQKTLLYIAENIDTAIEIKDIPEIVRLYNMGVESYNAYMVYRECKFFSLPGRHTHKEDSFDQWAEN